MDFESAVAVSLLPGISRTRAAATHKDLSDQGDVSLENVIAFCAPDAQVEAIAAAARSDARRLLAAAQVSRLAAVRWDDEAYPPLLRAVADRPPVLWVRGCVEALCRPAVAIVGSRAATPYALEVAARLAGELAERHLMVVSGLARGVDGAAHRGCVTRGGTTVGVLGCGPDIVYPREHDQLAAEICANGALISELGPGAPPLPDHFPLRNRLISGISLAVVVVEASEKSGSLITARYALEHGRDVMAVPGSILGGRNRGSHALLKDGAKVVETADDILEELGWPAVTLRQAEGHPERSRGMSEAAGGVEGPLNEISSKPFADSYLLSKLAPGETYDLDGLSATVGVAGSKLLPRLTEWEMQGRLVKVAGGRYVLGRK